MNPNDLTSKIIEAAITVHKHLGPGLLESAYEACMKHELQCIGLNYKSQMVLPVNYKGETIDCGYRLDLMVEDTVIVELKAIDILLPIHEAQLITYLKLADKRVGLLINFNVPVLKDGIKRMVNNF
jgi:GxxExxY protein